MKDRKSTHHILPRSRGGSNDGGNEVSVSSRRHNLYHQLFQNLTPEEILNLLNIEFWGEHYKIEPLKEVKR